MSWRLDKGTTETSEKTENKPNETILKSRANLPTFLEKYPALALVFGAIGVAVALILRISYLPIKYVAVSPVWALIKRIGFAFRPSSSIFERLDAAAAEVSSGKTKGSVGEETRQLNLAFENVADIHPRVATTWFESRYLVPGKKPPSDVGERIVQRYLGALAASGRLAEFGIEPEDHALEQSVMHGGDKRSLAKLLEDLQRLLSAASIEGEPGSSGLRPLHIIISQVRI